MKARKVKGLDPDGPLAANLARIVRVRVDELHSFDPAVRDPRSVKELHDMRIAAKRLRYILEMSEPVFGDPARHAAKDARRLQDVLGEIHDCDELLPWTRRHVKVLRADDAAAARIAAGDADDLPPAVLREAPNRRRYRGVEAVATYAAARRELLYGRFIELWSDLVRTGFRDRVERAVAA